MIKIRVPASTANLGPGFDVLAMSFKLYNEFTIGKSEELIIEGNEEKYNNEDNLVYKTLKAVMDEYDRSTNIHLKIKGDIPLSRGLGSSATCILAGVIGANYLMGDIMTEEEIYQKAVELEGHSDNVTSQYFGGLTMSLEEDGRLYYKKVEVAKGLKCTALIPDFTLSTEEAREILPEKVRMNEATYNIGHGLMTVEALRTGDFDNLKYYLNDRLHQDYRANLVNGYHKIVEKAYELGAYGAFLSGAGPTIMILRDEHIEFKEGIEAYLKNLDDQWSILDLELDNDGVIIEEI